jgi:periplasmic protein TonB
MKALITIIACFITTAVFSQAVDSVKIIDIDTLTTVRIEAYFPGGLTAWRKYLEQNLDSDLGSKYIKIPKGKKSATQTVIVSFVVDVDGTISDVKADNENEVHPRIAAESVRVIRKGPNWVPARLNGKKVKYRQKQSITWVVSED